MRTFRIFRDPEGGDSAGTVMAEAGSQSQEMEGQKPSADGSQSQETPAAQVPEAPAKSKGQLLAEILKKPKNYRATNEELDLMEEYWDGKLKPESDEEAETDEGPTPEDKPPEPKPKQKPAEALTSELQKELGAKSVEEILPKLRELKKFTGSRDAQAYKTLEQKHQTLERDSAAERTLWEDVKKGVPTAIDYLERQVAQARQRHNLPTRASQGEQGRQGQQGAQGDKSFTFIDPSKFTFPDEAAAINNALGGQFGEMRGLIEKQSETIRRLEEKDGKRDQEHLLNTAQAAQFDETLAVSSLIPELKNVPGLREKVAEWVRNPNAVLPELGVLQEVMDIANQNKTNLRIAWDSLEARRLRGQVAKAKDQGVREAYQHKPNQTLSDMQGKGGAIPFKNYTDAQLQQMESGRLPIPEEWLDKNGDLDETKMPERVRLRLQKAEGRA